MQPSGPLTPAELTELESTLLPALERHHLRLLAHGLRTLQAIAGQCGGPLPSIDAIADWVSQQPSLAGDPDFQQAFTTQLGHTAAQLEGVAASRGCAPLALELADLCAWAVGQADARLRP
ncbi:MAG: hypothetical protein VKL23_08040 [Cyanobacteriota bacterium]|nr:hypothetical protein [Cyanobacteriota bacterium]